jgi:PAS domain S-box-containing protein
VHPDDLERVMQESERTTRSLEAYSQEYRMIAIDGRVVWFHDDAVVVHDDMNRPVWQGVMIDITERQAEEAMQAAEARYRALVEQVPAAIYTQVIEEDRTTSTTFISPQAEDMLGYTVEETLAEPGTWRRILHPDDLERVLAEDEAGNATGEPFTMEYRMIAKDGRVVWIRDEATAVVGPEGRPLYWQGFMLDITERKQAEEQLEHALEVEREATRTLRALDR